MKKVNISVQWHITSNCSNRCKHCYISTESLEKIKSEEPTLEALKEIYDNIRSFEEKYNVSIEHFVLTGGDPFASPYFKDFARLLKNEGKLISLMSIPEAVTDENIGFLKEIEVGLFQMSLDGCENIHDVIRGKGSFAKTIAALKKLSENHIPAGIMYTVHKFNMEDMFLVIDELDALDLKVYFAFDFLIKEGNAAKHDICQMLEPNIVDSLFDKYSEKANDFKKKDSKVELTYKNKLLVLKQKLLHYEELPDQTSFSNCGGCYAGFSCVGILPNGDFTPCRRLDLVTGNLHRDSLEYLLLEEKTLRKMRRPQYYEYCGDCKYFKTCRGCMALAKAFNGDLWGLLCDTARNRLLMPKSIEDIRFFCVNSL